MSWFSSITGRCRNPFLTIRSRASVALVSVLAHSGFLVMISEMVTSLALMPAPTTRKAKSLAVNIPAILSSSSVTSTQSSRFAAISCAASATVVFGLIWRAWLGLRARTVPGGAFLVCRARGAPPFFLLRSASSLFRMACPLSAELNAFEKTGASPHPASSASAG